MCRGRGGGGKGPWGGPCGGGQPNLPPKYDAKGIMRLWAKIIPESTVLCADSFFGSHGLAEEFAAQHRPFLMLSKCDKRDAAAPQKNLNLSNTPAL